MLLRRRQGCGLQPVLGAAAVAARLWFAAGASGTSSPALTAQVWRTFAYVDPRNGWMSRMGTRPGHRNTRSVSARAWHKNREGEGARCSTHIRLECDVDREETPDKVPVDHVGALRSTVL